MCVMLVRLEPLLGIYSDLVRYYLAVSLGAHRSTGKLLSVLANIFTELAQKVRDQQTSSQVNLLAQSVQHLLSRRSGTCELFWPHRRDVTQLRVKLDSLTQT